MSEAALAAMFFYDAPGDTSGVLINKLGLRDQENLKQAEAAITSLRSQELPADSDVHSYEGFKAIHKHSFADIYARAHKIALLQKELPQVRARQHSQSRYL